MIVELESETPISDKLFYRYDGLRSWDYETVTIHESTFFLIKETPCGYWIKQELGSWGKKRWVSKTTRKRYAYPTKKEALESLMHRKIRQIGILKANTKIAEMTLEAVKERLK